MKNTESFRLVRQEAFDVQDPEISIAAVTSDVKVVESLDGGCHIEVFAKSQNLEDFADLIDIDSRGKKISIRIDKKNQGFRQFLKGGAVEMSIVLKLPKTAVLSVKSVSADVEVNPSLMSIEVVSVSGDISILQNPKTHCVLKTVSGDISAQTFSACQYSLKSVSGDITVHVAPGLEIDVDGKSVSGDLASEISLSSSDENSDQSSELVTINSTTVSGDFVLARS